MSIHATARTRNVRSRLGVWLQALTISGSPQIVLDGAPRDRVDLSDLWVRMTLDGLPESAPMLGDSYSAHRAGMLITLDVFAASGVVGKAGYTAYTIDLAADDLAQATRRLSLSFLDYSSTPSSPTTVTGARLRVIDPIEVRRLPSADNYDRRQILATARWILRHTP